MAVGDRIEIALKSDIPSKLPANGGVAETISTILPVLKGGTGADNATDALKNLGLTVSVSELNLIKGVTSGVQSQLNSKSTKSTTQNVTLSASGWTGSAAPFTYTMSIIGVTTSNIIELLPQSSLTTDQANSMVGAQIITGTQAANSLTLKAFGNKPTVDLPITIIIRGDI